MGGPIKWSVDAATNDTSDPDIFLAEGQPPPTLNNAARGIMAGVAKLLADQAGGLPAVGGAGGAIVVSTNQGFDATDVTRPFEIAFYMDAANTGPCTLSVDGTTARSLVRPNFTNVGPGDLPDASVIRVRRDPLTSRYVVVTPHIAPAGRIEAFGLEVSVPPGYVVCDGRAVSRTDYAALFQRISTTYGAGNGTTTFNVPDLRGRAAFGADNMGGVDAGRLSAAGGITGAVGSSGGTETVTLTEAQLAAHDHTGSTGTAGGVAAGTTGTDGVHNHGGVTGGGGGHTHTGDTLNSGNHTHTGSTTSEVHNHGYVTPQFTNITADSGAIITGLWSGTSSGSTNNEPLVLDFTTDPGGNHNHGLTVDAVANHTHPITSEGNHTHTIPAIAAHSHTVAIADAGGGDPHPNMPPGLCVVYAIKA